MSLKGKVALVTGAGSGIGAAIVRRFVKEGAKVCLNDINENVLKETAANLPSDSVAICAADVSKPQDVDKMITATLALGGKLDILVNSAGIDPHGKEIEESLDWWHKILEVNLTGPHMTMRAAIPHMIKAGGGSVINIASLAGIRFMSAHTAYTVSKAGLIALTQAAAVEYGPAKVRCNVICPGGTRTPMFENNVRPMAKMLGKDLDWVFSQFNAATPLRRITEPDEIAGVSYFLASEDASVITGQIMVADGGVSVIDASVAVGGVVFQNLMPKK
jgi:dihydroanticapsin dehydrogenase